MLRAFYGVFSDRSLTRIIVLPPLSDYRKEVVCTIA